ncbi:hypothetical protein NUKP33_48390 [Klebsiella variicola]|nr:hypothetical protein NUKP33_48390 [Klebsiella variicola]GKQ17702.1 hypothetical protein NUBL21980_09190 [Klebsiella michiganensis]
MVIKYPTLGMETPKSDDMDVINPATMYSDVVMANRVKPKTYIAAGSGLFIKIHSM